MRLILITLFALFSADLGWACASTSRNSWVNVGVFSLYCPQAFQVVQRNGSNQGTIPIKGTLPSGTHSVEARWQGGSWTTIASSVSGDFSGSLTGLTQGEGVVEVRIVGESEIISAAPVGVGEVLVVAGQSNSSGFAGNNQVYSDDQFGGLFGNDYNWKWAVDPSDINTNQVDTVSSDTTASGSRGSVWMLLAALVADQTGVPVAVVPCALGGSDAETDWQPGADESDRSTLFGSCNHRTTIVGGARVWLWWQGEQDAINGRTQAQYNTDLDTIANTLNSEQSIALMPCKLQNSSGIGDAAEALINDAIGDAWGDNANVLTGPDFTDLNSNDSFHLTSDANMTTAAARWETALNTAFGW